MKYSQEKIEEICKYISQGNTVVDSCALSDISKDTFYRWYREKSDFSDAIKKAKLKCKAEYIDIIKKASKKKWQAAAWWLERNYPSEYSTKATETKEKEEEEIDKTIEDLANLNTPEGLENSINVAVQVIKNAIIIKPELKNKYSELAELVNNRPVEEMIN